MKTYTQLLESIAPTVNPGTTTIYCDLDEVLVNFLDGAKKVLGKDFNDPYFVGKKSEKWNDLLNRNPRFWEQLDWMPGGKELWNRIKKYNPHILSAYPEYEGDDPNVAIEGKRNWCKRNLHIPERFIHVGTREQKKSFATTGDTPNLLIDDYISNVKEWDRAGGVAIHHRDVSDTVSRLSKMGFV
jgi:hypothetical protein